MADYKSSKEAFVSGITGSTVTHINMISIVALSSIALHSALRSRLPAPKTIHFPAEWVILVIPLLLSMTWFANNPGVLSLILLFPTGLLLLIPRRESGTPLPSGHRSQSPMRKNKPSSASTPHSLIAPLPALTTYRAHMLLMTIIAILAVDFPVFPRALAKCETFGLSLVGALSLSGSLLLTRGKMDLGVGSFVFSQGVVSAIPLLRDPSYLTAPMGLKFLSVSRKSLPIIFLGFARVLFVKGTEYPEHESEYGTHWNFFVTLALLPSLQVLLHPVITHVPVSFVGSIVAISHQIALSFFGLQKFVLHAPRTGFISANKEGIFSLAGYMAIHLLGLSTGTLILPPTPSYFRRRQHAYNQKNHRRDRSGDSETDNPRTPTNSPRRQSDKTATELFSYAAVWWAFMGLTTLLGIGAGVSRRMANLTYILWVAAYNTTFLFAYLLLDLFFFPSPLSKSVYSSTSKLKVSVSPNNGNYQQQEPSINPPALLEAINKNGLVVFLVANIATGIINMSISTMYMSDWGAMIILSIYAFAISGFAWLFRDRRIWQV